MQRTLLFVALALTALCVRACDLSPLEPEQCPQPCESACPQPPTVQVAVPPDCPGLPCMSECSNGCLEHFAGMATAERHCRHERHTLEAAWDAYHKEVAIRDAIIADRENVQRREVINEADHKAEHKGAREQPRRRHHHHHHHHQQRHEQHRRYYEHERVETQVHHHRYHAGQQHFFRTPTKQQQQQQQRTAEKKNKRKSYDYEQADELMTSNDADANVDADADAAAADADAVADDDDFAQSRHHHHHHHHHHHRRHHHHDQQHRFVSHPAALPVFAPFARPIISRTRVSFHHVDGVHSTQLPTHRDAAAGLHSRAHAHGHWQVFALPAHAETLDVHHGHAAYSHLEHHERYEHHHRRSHAHAHSSSSYRVLVHRRLDALHAPHGYIGSSTHAAHRAMVAAYRRAVHRHCAQSHHLSARTSSRMYSAEHREACAGRIFAQIERDPNAFPSQHEIKRIAARQRVQHKSVAVGVHHYHFASPPHVHDEHRFASPPLPPVDEHPFVPPPHLLAPVDEHHYSHHERHERHARRHRHERHHRGHRHRRAPPRKVVEENDRVIKEHDELRFGLEIPAMPEQPLAHLSPECDASNDGDSELYLQLCMCQCEKRCEQEENEFKARVAEENMLGTGASTGGGVAGLGPMNLPPLPGTAAAMGGGALSDYPEDGDADEQRRILEEVEAHHVEHVAEERAASSAFSGVANSAAAEVAMEGAPHVVTAHERFLGDENAPDAPVHWFAFDESADDNDDDASMI